MSNRNTILLPLFHSVINIICKQLFLLALQYFDYVPLFSCFTNNHGGSAATVPVALCHERLSFNWLTFVKFTLNYKTKETVQRQICDQFHDTVIQNMKW